MLKEKTFIPNIKTVMANALKFPKGIGFSEDSDVTIQRIKMETYRKEKAKNLTLIHEISL